MIRSYFPLIWIGLALASGTIGSAQELPLPLDSSALTRFLKRNSEPESNHPPLPPPAERARLIRKLRLEGRSLLPAIKEQLLSNRFMNIAPPQAAGIRLIRVPPDPANRVFLQHIEAFLAEEQSWLGREVEAPPVSGKQAVIAWLERYAWLRPGSPRDR